MSSNIIREVLEREFSQKSIQYFISGSFRFRYDTSSSDLDVVVLDNSILPSMIKDLGGGKVELGKNYIHNLTEITLFGGKVHLVIFTKLEDFLSLKKEHEEINSFLEENYILVTFLKELKTKVSGINGTNIYNAIKEVMKKSKKENNQEKEVRPSQRFLRIKTEEEVKK